MVDIETIELAPMKVYPPKVTVRNNILPPLEELRNCTTCHKGRPLPDDRIDPENYHYHCRDGVKGGLQHIGLKHNDNDCKRFIRKRSDRIDLSGL
jgi:hypothetical protein